MDEETNESSNQYCSFTTLYMPIFWSKAYILNSLTHYREALISGRSFEHIF